MSGNFIIHFKLKMNYNNELIGEMRVLLARKFFRTVFFKLLTALFQKIVAKKELLVKNWNYYMKYFSIISFYNWIQLKFKKFIIDNYDLSYLKQRLSTTFILGIILLILGLYLE